MPAASEDLRVWKAPDNMMAPRICKGDTVTIDIAGEPEPGCLVIVLLDDGFSVRYFDQLSPGTKIAGVAVAVQRRS
jgi:SOS-response transcriptional repressor LexA